MVLDYKELKKEFLKKDREIQREEQIEKKRAEIESSDPKESVSNRKFLKQLLWEYLVGK